jgi:hypothetical protein
MGIETPIKKILMENWDPIGVKDEPEAQSEYDSYAMQVLGLLYQKVSEDDLAEYLNSIVENHMGLKSDPRLTQLTVEKLVALELPDLRLHLVSRECSFSIHCR